MPDNMTTSEENRILRRTLKELLDNLAEEPLLKQQMPGLIRVSHFDPAAEPVLQAARNVSKYLRENRDEFWHRWRRPGIIVSEQRDGGIYIPAWNAGEGTVEDHRTIIENRVIFIPDRD